MSRANHERLVDYANTLRLAIKELDAMLLEARTNPAERKRIAAIYGGDLNEVRDVQEALRLTLHDFETSFSAYSPALLPKGIWSELSKTPGGFGLALFTTNLRNLSLGQIQVYLANESMGFMGNRMGMIQIGRAHV
mgnify:FL=1